MEYIRNMAKEEIRHYMIVLIPNKEFNTVFLPSKINVSATVYIQMMTGKA